MDSTAAVATLGSPTSTCDKNIIDIIDHNDTKCTLKTEPLPTTNQEPLDLPEHVWYMILSKLSGVSGQLRPLTYAVRDVMLASTTCVSAHRAACVLLQQTMCARVGAATEYAKSNCLWNAGRAISRRLLKKTMTISHRLPGVSDVYSQPPHEGHNPDEPAVMATRRIAPRIDAETKALMYAMRCHWVTEAEAKKLFRINATDIEAVTMSKLTGIDIRFMGSHQDADYDDGDNNVDDDHDDDPDFRRRRRRRGIHDNVMMLPPSCMTSPVRMYPVEQVREAAYNKHGTQKALQDLNERIRMATKKRLETRVARASVRGELRVAMGDVVFDVYIQGRLVGSQLHEQAKATEDACVKAGSQHIDEDSLRSISQMASALATRIDAEMPAVLCAMHPFVRSNRLRNHVANMFYRYAHSGRTKDMDHMRRVSGVLDAIFAEFKESGCLGSEDWGCIQALLCASSLEGTMAEYAQRSLEERQALRMQISQIVQGWGIFAKPKDAMRHPLVQRVLQLDGAEGALLAAAADAYTYLDMVDDEDDLEARLAGLRTDLEHGNMLNDDLIMAS
jgi:hypothetical protein